MRELLKIACITLSFCFGVANVYAQNIDVKGKILSETGESLPGVTITVENLSTHQKRSLSADASGIFVLNGLSVANKYNITFNYLGYHTETLNNYSVLENENNTLLIRMQANENSLDEVLVVGYGTQKKASITGSVATVRADELTKVPAPNMTAVLAGRLPGLIVNQNGGRPGADIASISIRGFGDPLVIVDGVQRSFSQLDPNEIESVTILRDASAAVYGVRAGNGVLLVTTKRGTIGKPAISYNGTYSLTEATNYPDFASFKEYESIAAAHRRGNEWQIFDAYITPERLAALNNGTDPGTNWADLVTRKFAPQQQQNINIRGGSEAIKFFFSGGYLNQGSQWKSGDYGFQRYNVSFNIDAEITKRLSASLDMGVRRELRNSSPADGNGDISDQAFGHPAFPSVIPEGRLPVVNTSNATSPIASTTESIGGFNKGNNNSLNGTFSLAYKIPGIDGLTAKGRFSALSEYAFGKRFETSFRLCAWDGTNFLGEQVSNGGIIDLTESNARFNRYTTNLSLDYNKKFDKHSISALLIAEEIRENAESVNAIGNDVISSAVPYLNYSNPDNRNATGSASEFGRTGIIGRINYDYAGKYLLELSMRRDKSPFFPENKRTGYFPGVSAGWIMTKEPFMKNLDFLSLLKLRTSFSKLGNDGPNAFDYIEGFEVLPVSGGYLFNNKFQTGIRTLGIPNPNITWQTSKLYNLGIEASFFNNKLSVEFETFYRLREGLLVKDTEGVQLPITVGGDVPFINYNSRANRGFEALISYRNKIGDFRYNVSGNISRSREKYKQTLEVREYDDPDRERIGRRSGQWVNRAFGYEFDGFFTQADIDKLINDQANNPAAYIDYGITPANILPGDIRVKDFNGDKKIDSRDQVVIGKGGTPEVMFGINLELQYKNWDLTMFWQGASGFYQNMDIRERGLQLHASGPRTPYKYLYNRVWTPETAATAIFPADLDGRFNNAFLDKYYIDSKYIRLKNLVIGYSIPQSVLKRVGVKRLRLYTTATNLFTADGLGIYPYDPETSGDGAYPLQRVFTFGLNLTL